MRLIRLPLSIAGATLLFAACDDASTTSPAAADAAAETSADVSGGTDVVADAVQDAAPDATIDAAPDPGSPDVAADATVDATPDPGMPDVQLDATADIGLDAQVADGSVSDGSVTDATVDGMQSDTGSGDTVATDVAQDAGTPDAGLADAVADASVDAAPDASVPDAMADTAPDATADGEVTCWSPDDQELQQLVGQPCAAAYDQQGFCDANFALAVGCSEGQWVSGTDPGSFLIGCYCPSFTQTVCGPEEYVCAAIGYVGIARAGAERHGGRALRLSS